MRCVYDITVARRTPPELFRRYSLNEVAAAIAGSRSLVPIGWHEAAARNEYGAVEYARTESRLCGDNVERLVFYELGEQPGIYAKLGILRVYLSGGRYVDIPAMFFEKADTEHGTYETLAYVPMELLKKLGYVEEVEMVGSPGRWKVVSRKNYGKAMVRA